MHTIRFATIGSGSIVKQFIRGAAHDQRFCLEAVYSRTLERAQEFAQTAVELLQQQADLSQGTVAQIPMPRLFTDLEQLAADPQIDAVYIASPNSCHAAQAILMLTHGKHVLCEKPFAVSTHQALAMMEAALNHVTPAGAPLVLMEAMRTTMLPNFDQVRLALPRIGVVRRYYAQFCQYSSRYDDYKRDGLVSNVFDPKMAGGSLVDLGVYGLAPLVHLFGLPGMPDAFDFWRGAFAGAGCRLLEALSGEVDRRLDALSARVHASAWKLGSGVDGMGTVLVEYPNMQAVVAHSKVSYSPQQSEIQGEDGVILIDKLSLMIHPQLVLRDGYTEDLSAPTIGNDMYYELHEFLNVIESGARQSAVNSWQRTLDVLSLMDVVAMSLA